ncbi:hypothetical protein KAM479c_25800 (plasmid) [Aeromonas caviae]|nr:hypothetical protein KAM479c_25800 [Aeromonas caviae]
MRPGSDTGWHGSRLSAERLALTLAGRFWNVNLQAGLFEYLRCNPPGGSKEGAKPSDHPGKMAGHARV